MIVVPVQESAVDLPTIDRVRHAAQAAPWLTRIAFGIAAISAVIIAAEAATGSLHGIGLGLGGLGLVSAALVDLHEFCLPNRLTGLAAGASLLGATATLQPGRVVECVAGGLICGAMMLVIHLRRGVGMGDVKAAAVVGMACGSVALIAAPVALAISAMTAAVTGMATHRARLAMGPSFVVGWVVTLGTSGWWLA